MYNVILHLHSSLRWVVLLLILIVIYRSATAGQRSFTSADKRFTLFSSVACDIMLLIGLYLWFFSERNLGLRSITQNSFSNVMKDPVARFFAIEHSIGMLLAIILVHIGKTYGKKDIPDRTKHKRTLLFFGLALLIILVSLPWPFREAGAGRGWY